MRPQPTPSTSRRRWPRRLAIASAIVGLALVAAYLWVTSNAFFERFVWPAVAAQTGCEVTVAEVDFNIFSRIGLKGFEIVGPEPERDRVAVGELEVSYGLFSLLRGAPRIRSVLISEVEASLTRRADGTLALLADAAPSEEEAEPVQVSVGALEADRIAVAFTDHGTGLPDPLAVEVVTSLRGASIDTAGGVEGLTINTQISARQGDHTDFRGGLVDVKADVVRSRDTLAVEAEVTAGGFRGLWRGTSLDGVALSLTSAVNTDDSGVARIETAELELRDGDVSVGRVSVTGSHDVRRGEGQFSVTLADVTHETLELLMARPGGVDFGDSRAEAHSEIALTQGGNAIAVTGTVEITDLTALAPEISSQRTPPLDLALSGAVTVDLAAETLHLRELNAQGDAGGRELLRGTLDQPIMIGWGGRTAQQVTPARFTASLSALDLSDVRPLLPGDWSERLRAGLVDAEIDLEVAAGGEEIALGGEMRVGGLVLAPEGTPLPMLEVVSDFDVGANLSQRQLSIRRGEAQITRGQETGTFSVVGDLDLARGEGTLQVLADDFDLTLPAMVAADEQLFTLTSGRVDTDTVVTLAGGGESVEIAGHSSWTGLDLALAPLGGARVPYDAGRLEHAGTLRGGDLTLSQVSVDLGERGRLEMAGEVDSTGDVRLEVRPRNLDLAAVSQMLSEVMPVAIDEGRAEGVSEVTLSGQDVRATFDGTVNLDTWGLPGLADVMPPLAVRGKTSSHLGAEPTVTVDLENLALTSRGQPAGTANGRVTVDLETFGLTFEGEAADLDVALARPFLPAGMPGAPRAGAATWSGSLRMTPRAGGFEIGAEGNGGVRGLALEDTGLPGAVVEPFDAQLRADVTLAMTPEALRLRSETLVAELTRGGERLGNVSVRGEADAQELTAELEAQIDALDLAALRPLLPPTLAERLEGGRLDFQGEISASGSTRLSSHGRVAITDALATVPGSGRRLTGIGLDLQHEVTLDQGRLQVRRADGTLTQGAKRGNFSATADLRLDPLTGTAEITLRDAALGGLIALVTDVVDPAVIADLVIDGSQRVEMDLGAEELSATGQISLRDALRVPTAGGDQLLQVSISDNVEMSGGTVQITDTRVVTRLGSLPEEAITLAGELDLTGEQSSTLTLTGGEVDLSPYLLLFGGQEAEPATPAPTEGWAVTLPDLPDPHPLRLRGEVAFERLTLDQLVLDDPSLAFNWSRFEPEAPDREFRVSRIDLRIPGPQRTGHLTGDLLGMQGAAGSPLNYSANLQLTECDFEALLPTLAPGMQDRVHGGFSLDRCQLSGEGGQLPRDLENLRGGISVTLASGELVRIPLLNAVVALTKLDVLERLQFFQGGVVMRPNGDHLKIEAAQPFWVRGDLTYMTVDGEVFYDGRQHLSLTPAVHESFPGLGGLMAEAARGHVFPRDPTYPQYRAFPLPIQSDGSWGRPRVRLGAPRVERILPGLLDELLENIE
jgi:hypothetical protein